MTSLAEVEESYYKAIRATKLSDANDCGTGDLASLYSKDAFDKWARQVDIYELDKEMANFALDEEIVKSFGDYRLERWKQNWETGLFMMGLFLKGG